MKKIIYLFLAGMLAVSCQENKTATVTVTNPSSFARNGEMVEVPVSDITAKLSVSDTQNLVVKDVDGKEIPYQLTYDSKLIFPANVAAGASASYTIASGTPANFETVATGRQYPERVDDLAWENDLVAFRAYGPALQATGERAFGYDVWTKRDTSKPVVEARYAMELNPETLAKIDSLRKVNPKAAQELRSATSYHVDHGNGLDCYKVGPTLGGGTAALMVDGNIVYPYAYKTQQILDNGPLRFTVKLTYNPLTVGNDNNVVETRVISLDAGSYLNKTLISFEGLSQATDIATGLVLHEPDGTITADAAKGFITYVDPTDNANADNGKIFVGAAFPGSIKDAKPVYFSDKEKADRGADGHVLAISDYQPGSTYTYYWGSAWSKANIKTAAEWDNYVSNYASAVRQPLTVSVN